MRRVVLATYGIGLALLLALSTSWVAGAHEGREVANGQFKLVVGFLDEPAFVGEKNAVIVEVGQYAVATGTPVSDDKADEGVPVLGLAESLQVDVIYGDQALTLSVIPLFNQPGAYVGYFFPMAEGDYSFRVYGEIDGNQIDETFTSGPETFSAVQSREPLEFPKQSSLRSQLPQVEPDVSLRESPPSSACQHARCDIVVGRSSHSDLGACGS